VSFLQKPTGCPKFQWLQCSLYYEKPAENCPNGKPALSFRRHSFLSLLKWFLMLFQGGPFELAQRKKRKKFMMIDHRPLTALDATRSLWYCPGKEWFNWLLLFHWQELEFLIVSGLYPAIELDGAQPNLEQALHIDKIWWPTNHWTVCFLHQMLVSNLIKESAIYTVGLKGFICGFTFCSSPKQGLDTRGASSHHGQLNDDHQKVLKGKLEHFFHSIHKTVRHYNTLL